MTEENTGSTELSEIKKVDAALESRMLELQDLQEAIEAAESQLDSVTGREIIGIDCTPVYHEAVIAAFNVKIGAINARIADLKKLRAYWVIAYGNARIPIWGRGNPQWEQWSPEIGDDGVEE